MQSFIIVAKGPEKKQEYIKKFCEEKNISTFDAQVFEPIENSFGIEEVRNIQKVAFLHPKNSPEKAIIINQAEKLTTEAQNALLKILEEPPVHTYVFLSATTENFFLPTILSRCKIIKLSEETTSSARQGEDITHQLELILSESIGDKLALAEIIAKDKEGAADWLYEIISLLRQKMFDDATNTLYPKLITQLQEASMMLQTTNINIRTLLEHTFLSQLNSS